MDKIFIEGLQVQSLIGVYDWERTQKQHLLVDATLFVDLQPAADQDDVNLTLDYAKVAQCIGDTADKGEYQLLEALASRMIADVFSQFPCQQLQLKLSKPGILPNAQNVAIELSRSR